MSPIPNHSQNFPFQPDLLGLGKVDGLELMDAHDGMMKTAIIEAARYVLAYVSQSSNIPLWSTYSIPMVIPTFRRASNTPRNRKQPLKSDADQNICCSSAAGGRWREGYVRMYGRLWAGHRCHVLNGSPISRCLQRYVSERTRNLTIKI